jgi:prepilin-type N-terminal cleavage/methylation domain-containing protein
MQRGYSVVELVIVLVVIGLMAALALPGWTTLLDRIAVERAATEVTTALAIARNAAVLRATRTRLTVVADSLRVDEWEDRTWRPLWRCAGPASNAVSLQVSNGTIIFGAIGIGAGPSNTTVVLRRGMHAAKITMSRVGRVKRW